MELRQFQVGPHQYVIPKHALQEIEGLEAPQRLLPSFKGEHLEQAQGNQLAPISPRASP